MTSTTALPVCVSEIIDESDNVSDDVHRFVRLMAAYESLIKLIAAACHAGICDGGAPRWYARRFRDGFGDTGPSLGDFNQIISTAASYFRKTRNALLSEVLDRVMHGSQDSTTAVFQLCRHIDQARRSLATTSPGEKFSVFQLFEKIVQLRNAYSHGSLTARFAKKYNSLLRKSLEEASKLLVLTEHWRLVIPLRPDPEDRANALAIEPDASIGRPVSMVIGDRPRIPWEDLHICAPTGSLEEAISLSPLVRFEQTLGKYQFANRYFEGELEYLSYQTGDSDIVAGFESWEECFGFPHIEEGTQDEDGETDPEKAEVPKGEGRDGTIDETKVRAHPPSEVPDVVTVPNAVSVVNAFVDHQERRALRDLLDSYEVKLHGLNTNELVDYFKSVEKEIAKRNDASLFGVLGALGLRIGLYEQAALALERQLDGGDQDKSVLQRLGRALLRWGAELKSMGKKEHDSELINRGKDVIKKSGDRLRDSLFEATDAPNERWHNVKSLSMLVDAYCKQGDFAAALDYCEKGIALAPDSTRLNSQRLYLFERGAG